MTTNQISLYKIRTENQLAKDQLAETKRQNVASLNEAKRHNSRTEDVQERSLLSQTEQWRSNLAENIRHNTAQEEENLRSHLQQELLTQSAQNEARRSNLARENESYRSNRAKESETRRSNLQKERLQADELSEVRRHNLTNEVEANRSAVAREIENTRHNTAVENETRAQNLRQALMQNRQQNLSELKTRQDFQIANDKNLETLRHNLATEDQSLMSIHETKRSNLANEGIKRDTLSETSRNNFAKEKLGAFDTASKAISTVTNAASSLVNMITKSWVSVY